MISHESPGMKVIVMAPHMDRTFGEWFSNCSEITWVKDWGSALDLLKGSFGPGTRVAVIPNATMQYCDSQKSL